MSTVIRTHVSKKNPYYIEKNRYLELKHFCLQYPDWKVGYAACDSIIFESASGEGRTQKEYQDPVGDAVARREFFYDRITTLDRVASETDEVIGHYILRGVTSGLSYEALNASERIPCCRQVYYELYRKFFWLLDKVRG